MPRKGTVKPSFHRNSVIEKFASPKFGEQKKKQAVKSAKKTGGDGKTK